MPQNEKSKDKVKQNLTKPSAKPTSSKPRRNSEVKEDKEEKISVKIHSAQGMTIVAACDIELLGKKLVEKEIVLEVHRGFYEGVYVDEEGFIRHLALGMCGNLVGKYTVEAAIKANYVDKNSILYIEGVPHAQFFVLPKKKK
ncbi:MAG: DUF424 family protein [Thermoplasmata archaeon]